MKERVVFLVAVLGMPALLWSQDLADAARKEKERRSKVQAAGGTLTNDDLKTTKGQLANDPSQAPLAPADPASRGRSAASPTTIPKANLERAREALADFEEGARRAGVPMAWLSE